MTKSKLYKNPYDAKGVKRGTEWMEKRAIVKCKNGHIFSFAHWSGVTEWGHHMGAWCEECGDNIHAMELEFIKFDEKQEWSAMGGPEVDIRKELGLSQLEEEY